MKFFKPKTLPAVTTPYRLALEQTQERYALLLIVTLIALGYYSYVYTLNKTEAEALVPIVVAKQDLIYPRVLTVNDLTLIEVPEKWRPKGATQDLKSAVGKTLLRDLVAFEPVLPTAVSSSQDPDSITAEFKRDFAFVVGEEWLVSKIPRLAAGDRVDVLASNPKAIEAGVITVAQAVPVLKVSTEGGRRLLVLNTTPEQAASLLQSRGLRLPMQILIHNNHLFESVLIKPTSL